ncbi:hypothetical protein CYB_1395 [Synechococcus sp. JA-2-3B'a(2-13)]|nr:hypothetical protein CYB_1395 [Synechococcus sp. JA-2-3B'a(2-13)]
MVSSLEVALVVFGFVLAAFLGMASPQVSDAKCRSAQNL